MAEGKIIGYVNVYRQKDGSIQTGSIDAYPDAESARVCSATEFVAGYLGVATLTLTPAVGQPNE